MNELKAPQPSEGSASPSIFFAGSIEMGKAVDWQKETTKKLQPYLGTIFNPRREDWDSSWTQSIENAQFKEQVTWELDHLEKADYILMYFAPDTQSPISLLEFGVHYKEGKMFVACPKKFWRRGNIEVMCDRAGITLYDTLDEAVAALVKEIESKYDGQNQVPEK